MTARESIEALWDRATPVTPLLDAYRAEVLREAARMLRDADPHEQTYEYGTSWRHAALFLDPDQSFKPDPMWLVDPYAPEPAPPSP